MTDYRNLGATGIKVSPLTLGTMMFGAIGNPDHDASIRIIHHALDSGINLVDTADVYSQGESETIVGKALKGPAVHDDRPDPGRRSVRNAVGAERRDVQVVARGDPFDRLGPVRHFGPPWIVLPV